MTVLVPGGGIGILLKSEFPCSCASVDNLGLILYVLNIFNVVTTCGIILSHSCIGKLVSVVKMPATKWFLSFCIALSAAFTW